MIISTEHLTKRFERRKQSPFTAVDDISFSIGAGERVAFIGPNGAGKSTTLKMLTGILTPTTGDAQVAGLVPWEARQALAGQIGIVFGQRSQLWHHLPVRDSFHVLAKIYAVHDDSYRQRARHLTDILRIGHLLDQPVKSLSLGQRMRCEIAASLLHGPKILFLDEPTIGLDVTAKALLREHLRALAEQEAVTIMLTSHDTGDIEEICDRVILINHGRILLDKPLKDLRATFTNKRLVRLVTEEESPVFSHKGVRVESAGRHNLVLSVDTGAAALDKVIAAALRQVQVQDLAIENAPLESVIRQLYGENA